MAPPRRPSDLRAHRRGRPLRGASVLAMCRAYGNVLRDLAFLASTAHGWEERVALLRFYVRQFLWNLGIGERQDVRIRFRDLAYVVTQSVELHALAEVYRDRIYSRRAEFLPAPASVVVDAGANVGVFAVFHAARGARVLALEPNPDAYRRLSATVAENRMEAGVTPLEVAVGAQSGSGCLTVPSGLSVLGAVEPVGGSGGTSPETIKILTLDELLASHELPAVDLLKIDVEGAEAAVLRGAASALPRVRRVVLEYHSRALLSECRGLLTTSGFQEIARTESARGIGMLYAAR